MSELTPEAVAVIRSRVALRELTIPEALAVVEALSAAYPDAEIGAWERRGGWGLAAKIGSETVAGSIDEVRKWLAANSARKLHGDRRDVQEGDQHEGRTERSDAGA